MPGPWSVTESIARPPSAVSMATSTVASGLLCWIAFSSRFRMASVTFSRSPRTNTSELGASTTWTLDCAASFRSRSISSSVAPLSPNGRSDSCIWPACSREMSKRSLIMRSSRSALRSTVASALSCFSDSSPSVPRVSSVMYALIVVSGFFRSCETLANSSSRVCSRLLRPATAVCKSFVRRVASSRMRATSIAADSCAASAINVPSVTSYLGSTIVRQPTVCPFEASGALNSPGSR